MIISIILIGLSVLFSIGVWLYIRKQDNVSITSMNNTNNKKIDKPITNLNIAAEKFSIDDISNDIFTLENFKKRTTLLQIKNSDFNMLSQEGQDVTEDILRQLALSLQYDIGFYSTTRVIDTNKPLQETRTVLNSTENANVQRYSINYINYFESVMTTQRIAEREDYIILTYVGDMKLSTKELERRAIQFIDVLKKINTKCEIVPTDKLIDLLYHDLNRNDFFNPSSSIKLGALDLYVGHNERKGVE